MRITAAQEGSCNVAGRSRMDLTLFYNGINNAPSTASFARQMVMLIGSSGSSVAFSALAELWKAMIHQAEILTYYEMDGHCGPPTAPATAQSTALSLATFHA